MSHILNVLFKNNILYGGHLEIHEVNEFNYFILKKILNEIVYGGDLEFQNGCPM
jgi:hypothetical protein